MQPSKTLQGSSVNSSSMSPKGLGGNPFPGASFNKYSGPYIGRPFWSRCLFSAQLAETLSGRGRCRFMQRLRDGDGGPSLARWARPRDISAALAEGNTSPCSRCQLFPSMRAARSVRQVCKGCVLNAPYYSEKMQGIHVKRHLDEKNWMRTYATVVTLQF